MVPASLAQLDGLVRFDDALVVSAEGAGLRRVCCQYG